MNNGHQKFKKQISKQEKIITIHKSATLTKEREREREPETPSV